MRVYEDMDCEDFLTIEKIQFPIPGQQLPPDKPMLDASDKAVHLYDYGDEKLVYGMPTYHFLGLRLV